ncbi:uncharacterized protein MONOS_310 [Monocercomonoides exilis]|uniref:uncharacterized protein n=1 Tax=Monocercomonoides exilis TaxID=2049356 RepID=UPI00355A22E7|nr:hypothetical protein MONOS_310 [Monocercomonoides exilis]|eukprot:MONOS_310.1-p1 / transcript=MONOS_310.1 / gene=MONOS_310 / organism=Monocercomonoides_exilis_PA203 / gene_product=unspecified product / transcript_product=unspecified product / location=Mono_scaffold00005:108045-114268(-) / protein_length=2051 / sequence_SO=supercontig / SO=protein_coding / is_pseudo=false
MRGRISKVASLFFPFPLSLPQSIGLYPVLTQEEYNLLPKDQPLAALEREINDFRIGVISFFRSFFIQPEFQNPHDDPLPDAISSRFFNQVLVLLQPHMKNPHNSSLLFSHLVTHSMVYPSPLISSCFTQELQVHDALHQSNKESYGSTSFRSSIASLKPHNPHLLAYQASSHSLRSHYDNSRITSYEQSSITSQASLRTSVPALPLPSSAESSFRSAKRAISSSHRSSLQTTSINSRQSSSRSPHSSPSASLSRRRHPRASSAPRIRSSSARRSDFANSNDSHRRTSLTNDLENELLETQERTNRCVASAFSGSFSKMLSSSRSSSSRANGAAHSARNRPQTTSSYLTQHAALNEQNRNNKHIDEKGDPSVFEEAAMQRSVSQRKERPRPSSFFERREKIEKEQEDEVEQGKYRYGSADYDCSDDEWQQGRGDNEEDDDEAFRNKISSIGQANRKDSNLSNNDYISAFNRQEEPDNQSLESALYYEDEDGASDDDDFNWELLPRKGSRGERATEIEQLKRVQRGSKRPKGRAASVSSNKQTQTPKLSRCKKKEKTKSKQKESATQRTKQREPQTIKELVEQYKQRAASAPRSLLLKRPATSRQTSSRASSARRQPQNATHAAPNERAKGRPRPSSQLSGSSRPVTGRRQEFHSSSTSSSSSSSSTASSISSPQATSFPSNGISSRPRPRSSARKLQSTSSQPSSSSINTSSEHTHNLSRQSTSHHRPESSPRLQSRKAITRASSLSPDSSTAHHNTSHPSIPPSSSRSSSSFSVQKPSILQSSAFLASHGISHSPSNMALAVLEQQQRKKRVQQLAQMDAAAFEAAQREAINEEKTLLFFLSQTALHQQMNTNVFSSYAALQCNYIIRSHFSEFLSLFSDAVKNAHRALHRPSHMKLTSPSSASSPSAMSSSPHSQTHSMFASRERQRNNEWMTSMQNQGRWMKSPTRNESWRQYFPSSGLTSSTSPSSSSYYPFASPFFPPSSLTSLYLQPHPLLPLPEAAVVASKSLREYTTQPMLSTSSLPLHLKQRLAIRFIADTRNRLARIAESNDAIRRAEEINRESRLFTDLVAQFFEEKNRGASQQHTNISKQIHHQTGGSVIGEQGWQNKNKEARRYGWNEEKSGYSSSPTDSFSAGNSVYEADPNDQNSSEEDLNGKLIADLGFEPPPSTPETNHAATVIQTAVRGYLCRLKRKRRQFHTNRRKEKAKRRMWMDRMALQQVIQPSFEEKALMRDVVGSVAVVMGRVGAESRKLIEEKRKRILSAMPSVARHHLINKMKNTQRKDSNELADGKASSTTPQRPPSMAAYVMLGINSRTQTSAAGQHSRAPSPLLPQSLFPAPLLSNQTISPSFPTFAAQKKTIPSLNLQPVPSSSSPLPSPLSTTSSIAASNFPSAAQSRTSSVFSNTTGRPAFASEYHSISLPLPPQWVPQMDPMTGRQFFMNTRTGEESTVHPQITAICNDVEKKLNESQEEEERMREMVYRFMDVLRRDAIDRMHQCDDRSLLFACLQEKRRLVDAFCRLRNIVHETHDKSDLSDFSFFSDIVEMKEILSPPEAVERQREKREKREMFWLKVSKVLLPTDTSEAAVERRKKRLENKKKKKAQSTNALGQSSPNQSGNPFDEPGDPFSVDGGSSSSSSSSVPPPINLSFFEVPDAGGSSPSGSFHSQNSPMSPQSPSSPTAQYFPETPRSPPQSTSDNLQTGTQYTLSSVPPSPTSPPSPSGMSVSSIPGTNAFIPPSPPPLLEDSFDSTRSPPSPVVVVYPPTPPSPAASPSAPLLQSSTSATLPISTSPPRSPTPSSNTPASPALDEQVPYSFHSPPMEYNDDSPGSPPSPVVFEYPEPSPDEEQETEQQVAFENPPELQSVHSSGDIRASDASQEQLAQSQIEISLNIPETDFLKLDEEEEEGGGEAFEIAPDKAFNEVAEQNWDKNRIVPKEEEENSNESVLERDDTVKMDLHEYLSRSATLSQRSIRSVRQFDDDDDYDDIHNMSSFGNDESDNEYSEQLNIDDDDDDTSTLDGNIRGADFSDENQSLDEINVGLNWKEIQPEDN